MSCSGSNSSKSSKKELEVSEPAESSSWEAEIRTAESPVDFMDLAEMRKQFEAMKAELESKNKKLEELQSIREKNLTKPGISYADRLGVQKGGKVVNAPSDNSIISHIMAFDEFIDKPSIGLCLGSMPNITTSEIKIRVGHTELDAVLFVSTEKFWDTKSNIPRAVIVLLTNKMWIIKGVPNPDILNRDMSMLFCVTHYHDNFANGGFQLSGSFENIGAAIQYAVNQVETSKVGLVLKNALRDDLNNFGKDNFTKMQTTMLVSQLSTFFATGVFFYTKNQLVADMKSGSEIGTRSTYPTEKIRETIMAQAKYFVEFTISRLSGKPMHARRVMVSSDAIDGDFPAL